MPAHRRQRAPSAPKLTIDNYGSIRLVRTDDHIDKFTEISKIWGSFGSDWNTRVIQFSAIVDILAGLHGVFKNNNVLVLHLFPHWNDRPIWRLRVQQKSVNGIQVNRCPRQVGWNTIPAAKSCQLRNDIIFKSLFEDFQARCRDTAVIWGSAYRISKSLLVIVNYYAPFIFRREKPSLLKQ
jgi:hypothetical protein